MISVVDQTARRARREIRYLRPTRASVVIDPTQQGWMLGGSTSIATCSLDRDAMRPSTAARASIADQSGAWRSRWLSGGFAEARLRVEQKTSTSDRGSRQGYERKH